MESDQPVNKQTTGTGAPTQIKFDQLENSFSQNSGSDPNKPTPINMVESMEVAGNNKKSFLVKKLIWILVICIFALGVLGGGVWGFMTYNNYSLKVSLNSILPENSQLVARISIDPSSAQYAQLEEHLKKFPGYDLFKKELDTVGEGKTLSQAIQDKIKDLGLDFQSDIKPALGEQAFLVIPDLNPLGKTLQNKVLLTYYQTKDLIEQAKVLEKFLPEPVGAILNQKKDDQSDEPQVLGESKTAESPLDFLLATNIKDLEKAKEALEKMKKDANYELAELEYSDQKYVRIKLVNVQDDSAARKIINFKETYHAMLGGNWIATSTEKLMHDSIDRFEGQRFVDKNLKKRSLTSLENDEKFIKVFDKVNENQESLISVYAKINFNTFFRNNDCRDTINCQDVTQYIKYPDDLIFGLAVRFDQEGLIWKSLSNRFDMQNLANRPISSGLATKIPQKVADRWTNIFVENSNIKNIYYAFKRNNLTDKGLTEWNNLLDQIGKVSGINFEREIIDQNSGNTALAMFTSRNAPPQGAIIAEITDSGQMLETMRKLIKFAKAFTLGLMDQQTEMYKSGSFQESLKKADPAQKKLMLEQQQNLTKSISKIIASDIVETITSDGKIYSYKLPMNMPGSEESLISFDFSLENNQFILGSHYSTVEGLLKEMKNNTSSKLAENDYYRQALKYASQEGYGFTFVYTPGVWDIFNYVFDLYSQSMSGNVRKMYENCDPLDARCLQIQSGSEQLQQDFKDRMFAIGAVIRTMRIFSLSDEFGDNFSKSSMFVNFHELPKEEKDRAEAILRNFR